MPAWTRAAEHLPPEVSGSCGKEGKEGVLVFLSLYSVLMLALRGFGAQMAAVILLKQLHGDSVFLSEYQVKPNGWPVCYGLLIEQHSVLVCIKNYLHKIVLVTI